MDTGWTSRASRSIPAAASSTRASRPTGSGDQVRVGRDLILSILRVAQANAYVFGGRAPASLDMATAVGRYMMAVSGALAADVPGRSWRVPEISEFYGMSKSEALKLAGDDGFNRLSDYVFGEMMTFILSHEYAHLALGHLRTRPTPGSATFLDQELAADELGARMTGQIAHDNVVGATMPILVVLGYYAQKGVPIAEVRELCTRSMSVARSDVENFLLRLHSDEEVRNKMRENGIDIAAYERAAERMSRMEAGCATMVR